MRTRSAGRARRRLALTPLIDVIFLLLLFFMLSSSFSRHGEVELTLGGGGGTDGGSERTVFVRVGPGGIEVNGRLTDDPRAAVGQLADGGAVRLLLAASDGATAQHLVAAMATLGKVPDSALVVVR